MHQMKIAMSIDFDASRCGGKKGSSFLNCLCAPPGARTLDPNIKSVVLYQLS